MTDMESRKRVIVYHRSYGCDTGCCGHVVEVDGQEIGDFEFSHPYAGRDNFREWAEDLVREHGCDPADLDWDNCVVTDD